MTRPSFDPAALLGSSVTDLIGSGGDHSPGLAIDHLDQRLAKILEDALLTGAESASLMLLDVGRMHLGIAAAKGLQEEKIQERLGDGIASQVFATGKAAISRGQARSAEMNGRPLCQIAVPVMISGRSVGVLSINATSAEALSDDDILTPLNGLTRNLPLVLLAAVELKAFPKTEQRAVLQCLIDGIMSLDEALPIRLAACVECLRKLIGANAVSIYWLDPLGGVLHEMPPHHPAPVGAGGGRAHKREFLAEIMRQRHPVVLGAGGRENEREATIYYPVRSSHSHSVIVFENVPIEDDGQERLSLIPQEVVRQLEAMIVVEECLAAQELLAELHMRIADLGPGLDKLPSPKRTRALLALLLGLIPVDVAIWITPDKKGSIMTPCLTPDSVRIQKWASERLQTLADWAREQGNAAKGMVATSWDTKAPKGPAPYGAILDQDERGTLLVFFGSVQRTDRMRQISSHVVWQVLSRLCLLIVGEKEEYALTRPDQAEILDSEAYRVLAAPVLAKIAHHECMRSRRYGHSWSLICVQLPAENRDRKRETLLVFLLRATRQVDFISEIRPGVFVILLVQTGDAPDVILQRLTAKWRLEQPDLDLKAEQRNFPGGGDPDATLEAWIANDSSFKAAA